MQINFLNVMPPPIRTLLLRLILKKFLHNSYIDYGFYFRFPRKISIGSNVEINRNCAFYPSYHIPEAQIILEDNVILGPSVTLLCAGQDKFGFSRDDVGGPITIKKGAYIGANVTVRYGVTIGENSTIGAGATVVKDIPPFSVVVGNPSRIIS